MCLFVLFCLFVSSFCPTREFFTHLETITGEGLQIFTICSVLVAIEHEESLACHTYCDTGHPFIVVISEDPWHSHLLPSVWQWNYHYLFLWLKSVEAGIRTQLSACGANTLTHCAIAAAMKCEVSTRVKKFWPDVGEYFKLLYIWTSYRTQFILATNTVQIVNRHPPFGNQLRDMVTGLPKYELTIEQVSLFN